MSLKINGSTSGSVSLDAPATGGDVSLTLPTLGFGKVLQVVQETTTTEVANNTNVYADTGLSASITPSSTSSRILLLISQHYGKTAGSVSNCVDAKILRGATEVVQHIQDGMWTNSALVSRAVFSTVYLDSPNTTSSITYKTTFRNDANATGVLAQPGNGLSTMILVEIGP